MILTLDVGNMNIVFGGVVDGNCVFTCRLNTVRTRTADEYAVLLSRMSEQRGVDIAGAAGAIISSVVPQLTQVISDALVSTTGKTPMIVGPGVKTGLNIRIDDPAELGTDFVAAAVAALDRYDPPCVTIDMSTATALGVVDPNGNYIGGVICPGLLVAHDALADSTAQLRHVRIAAPKHVIEKSTAASIQSGLVFGNACMLDGLLDRIEEELGVKPTVVATGEQAEVVLAQCRRKDIIYDAELMMRGLWLIYKRNCK